MEFIKCFNFKPVCKFLNIKSTEFTRSIYIYSTKKPEFTSYHLETDNNIVFNIIHSLISSSKKNMLTNGYIIGQHNKLQCIYINKSIKILRTRKFNDFFKEIGEEKVNFILKDCVVIFNDKSEYFFIAGDISILKKSYCKNLIFQNQDIFKVQKLKKLKNENIPFFDEFEENEKLIFEDFITKFNKLKIKKLFNSYFSNEIKFDQKIYKNFRRYSQKKLKIIAKKNSQDYSIASEIFETQDFKRLGSDLKSKNKEIENKSEGNEISISDSGVNSSFENKIMEISTNTNKKIDSSNISIMFLEIENYSSTISIDTNSSESKHENQIEIINNKSEELQKCSKVIDNLKSEKLENCNNIYINHNNEIKSEKIINKGIENNELDDVNILNKEINNEKEINIKKKDQKKFISKKRKITEDLSDLSAESEFLDSIIDYEDFYDKLFREQKKQSRIDLRRELKEKENVKIENYNIYEHKIKQQKIINFLFCISKKTMKKIFDHKNFRTLKSKIANFVYQNKNESISIHSIHKDFAVRDILLSKQSSDQIRNIKIFRKVLAFLFNEIYLPLISIFFYKTEVSVSKNKQIYFQKKIWKFYSFKFTKNYLKTFQEVEDINFLKKDKNFKVSFLKIYPKENGSRMITDMKKGEFNAYDSSNANLNHTFQILKFIINKSEKKNEILQNSILKYSEIYKLLDNLDFKNKFILKFDAVSCFDKIKKENLMPIVEKIFTKKSYTIYKNNFHVIKMKNMATKSFFTENMNENNKKKNRCKFFGNLGNK